MTQTHTSGPWTIHSKLVGPLHIEANGVAVAHVGAEDFATCEANCRLISAAPDLLAALEVVHLAFEQGYYVVNDKGAAHTDIIAQITAALKKAKGE